MLRESGDDLPMAMLSNGCVCCQIGSDLAFTIDRLIMAPRPDGAGPLRRIILETSGLSMPGPVLRTLATLAEHRMKVAVVGTFDLTRGTEVAAFEEAVAQWAAAHRIVATKADLVACGRLRECIIGDRDHQSARRSGRDGGSCDALSRRCLRRFRHRCRCARSARIAPPRIRGLRSVWCRPTGDVAYPDLADWLDNLAGALGERLLRIKGLVRVTESEAAAPGRERRHVFSPPRPLRVADGAPSSFLVVIGRDVGAGRA